MKKQHKYQTIKHFVIRSMILIYILPILLVWVSILMSSFQTVKETAVDTQSKLVAMASVSLENRFLSIVRSMAELYTTKEIRQILKLPHLLSYDSTLYNNSVLFDKLSTKAFSGNEIPENIILSNMKGEFISKSVVTEDIKSYFITDFSEKNLLHYYKNTHIIGNLSGADNKPAFLMAEPIMDLNEFEFIGVMYVVYNLDFFSRTAELYPNFSVLDPEYRLLYSEQLESDFFEEKKEELQSSDYFETTVMGEKYALVQSALNEFGLHVVAHSSVSEIFKTMLVKQLYIMIIVVCAILLGSLFAVYIYKKLYKNILKISNRNTDIEMADTFEYYEIKQIDDKFTSLIRTHAQGEEQIAALINRCDTIALDKLQAQINPHFLYNTLSSIKYVAIMNDQEQISKLITALVTLMRSTINRDGMFITLEKELENVDSYMYIQNSIYSNNIDFVLNITEELLKLQIPNFILQPFLENSIFHGIHPDEKTGKITVSAAIENGDLQITIVDNGDGLSENFVEKLMLSQENTDEKHLTNFGIKGVQEKIQLLCGESYGVSFSGKKGVGTTVKIRLPVIDSNSDMKKL